MRKDTNDGLVVHECRDRARSEIVNYNEYRDNDKMQQDESMNLCAETVECAARTLEGIDDIEGGDGFPLGVLGVCYRVADDLQRVIRGCKRKWMGGNTRSQGRF